MMGDQNHAKSSLFEFLIEHAGSAITIITIFCLLLASVKEIAFSFLLDLDIYAIISPTDMLKSSLLWLPVSLVVLGVFYSNVFVKEFNVSKNGIIRQFFRQTDSPLVFRAKKLSMWCLFFCACALILILFLFLVKWISGFNERFVFVGMIGFFVMLIGMIFSDTFTGVFGLRRAVLNRPNSKYIIDYTYSIAIILFAGAWFQGCYEGARVHSSLHFKSSTIIDGRTYAVVRLFEKGAILRNLDDRTLTLVDWDKIGPIVSRF